MSRTKYTHIPVLQFRSIPSSSGNGETMLTVHPPDDSDEYYKAYVGGCCVGTRPSMEQACELLLERAMIRCASHVREANRELMHYSAELDRLRSEGLTTR